MKTILAPYPPPYRGVELQAKLEFEKSKGKVIFIGTSNEPGAVGRGRWAENLILVKRGPFIKNCPQLFFKIWANKGRISEINAHYATTFGFLAYLAKMFFGIKYTVTCHGSDVLVNMEKPFYRFFNNLALRNAEKIFVVSRDLGAHLIEHGYHYKDIEHRQNQVDKTIFRKIQGVKKKKQVLFAGGLQASKGTDLLIEAFAKFSKKFPNYKLIIVGVVVETEFYQKLKEIVKKKALSAKVLFLGEKTPPELAEIMNESQLFAMPSRYEGYGVALSEALACGMKAIATNVGGLREAGKGGKCVFLNPDVDEIARAMEKQLKGRAK